MSVFAHLEQVFTWVVAAALLWVSWMQIRHGDFTLGVLALGMFFILTHLMRKPPRVT